MKEWFEGKSVAIVGNAMSLFNKEYGKEIDSHDVVVRLNKAAMLYESFHAEKSHGRRTDVWMFWRTAEYKKHFPNIDKNIKKMHMGHQDRKSGDITLVDYVYPDSLYGPLKKKAGNHNNPTTGLMAIDYVLNCNPSMITVYGFDWKETPTYTDPERKKEKQCPHDYTTEKKYCEEVFFSRPNVFLRR
jgi:hypothetical protein